MKTNLTQKLLLTLGSGLLVASVAGCAPGSLFGSNSNQTSNQASNEVSAGSGSTNATNGTQGSGASGDTGNSTNNAGGNNGSGSGTSNGASSGSGSSSTNISIPKQKTLSYQIEGETDSKTATAYISSNQPFYMYVMSGYKATPEEPGKDIITFDQNDGAWMRIEVLQPGLSASQIETDAKNILKSTSSNIQTITQSALPSNQFFTNVKAWVANGTNVSSEVYVADVNGTPVRFFVQLPREWESPAQFRTMMTTLHLVQSGQTVNAS